MDTVPIPGASGDSSVTPPTTPTTPVTTPVFDVKDGVMTVDGKKLVLESDLIAAKKSLEKLAEEAQTVHNEAIDKAKLDLSEAQQQVATSNAKIQELEQASKSGAVSDEEAARVKQELEAAKGSAEQAAAKALELRKQNVILTSGGVVTAEQLKDKTEEQLNSFEEALRAISQNRGGPGPYAIGGGGSSTTPPTPIERAAALIANTPYRGVRNEPPNKPE